MSAAEFLDTNILVYAFSTDPRAKRSTDLIAAGCTVGVQGLNEFTNVARRKLGMSWEETAEALATIRTLCMRVMPSTLIAHERALELARVHGFPMFDAVMIATALEAGCATFWSEDLHAGTEVGGAMVIRNPFTA